MTASEKRRVWFENFHQAILTIRAHKFRAFLTVLGVLIGVMTVILVATILTGLRGQLVSMIEEYGTTNIYAFHLNTGIQMGRRSRKEFERKPLQIEYIRPILYRCDSVQDISYELFPRHLSDRTVKYQGVEFNNPQIEGVSANYFDVANQHISLGRALSEADDTHRLFNCVIGWAVYESLFPQMQPIGKEIQVGGKRFKVVGVLAKPKTSLLGENESEQSVLIPYLTLKKISPRDEWVFLIIRAKSGETARAMDQAESVLRSLRRLKSTDDNDFSMSTADSLIKQFDAITATVGLVAIGLSSVSLLVGGIGVMNILLVSVKERTREIGVRKAIGARRSDVTVQFLIEAMTLTGMGGIFGIVLAVAAGLGLSLVLPNLPTIIPMWAVTMAFVTSILIGLVFGVWPATRAARLDPIEALRYE
jgi:putative ABC transport system permease protein